jgi:hypothetical protein
VLLSVLMPWEELDEPYAPQFSPTVGAPAKPVRLAFGALFIRQRLGLTDAETIHQIQQNPYIHIQFEDRQPAQAERLSMRGVDQPRTGVYGRPGGRIT